MGFRLKVEKADGSAQEFSFDERAITAVEFSVDSPENSNARATGVSIGATVRGKMLINLAGGNEATKSLSDWSRLHSWHPDCYRKVTIQLVAAGLILRKYVFPHAFVLGYMEKEDDVTGVGEFELHFKQKKDLNNEVNIAGGDKDE